MTAYDQVAVYLLLPLGGDPGFIIRPIWCPEYITSERIVNLRHASSTTTPSCNSSCGTERQCYGPGCNVNVLAPGPGTLHSPPNTRRRYRFIPPRSYSCFGPGDTRALGWTAVEACSRSMVPSWCSPFAVRSGRVSI